MESDSRKLTAKILANSDNPIWSYMIFQSFDFFYAALSGGTLLQSVMSQQYNCLMELYTRFSKVLLFTKILSSLYFFIRIYRDVRAKMIVHALMIELDQPDYWYPIKI